MSSEVKNPLHEVRFPGESDEYRRARLELLQAVESFRAILFGVIRQTARLSKTIQ